MKLLIISAAFPPMKSGGADYAMRLAGHLVKQGLEVHVLTSTGTDASATTFSVKPLIRQWSWKDALAIHRVAKELQPDIVDIHFTGWVYNDNPMITFAPTLIRHAAPGAHIAVHIESLGGVRRELSRPLDVAVRRLVSQFVGRDEINYEYGTLVRDSDTVIFLNQRDREELTRLCPDLPGKSIVAPPPPIMQVSAPISEGEIRSVRTDYGMDDREIVLGFYGYVYPGKGIETLLSAVYHVAAQQRDVGLFIVGGLPEQKVLDRAGRPNYLDELKALAQTMNITQRLRWIGYSEPDSQLPSRILRACHMCVLPFDDGVMLNNSSFSFAAMHDIAIITTEGKHTENVFVHGQNTLLVPSNNVVRLSQAILKLADDPSCRQKISAGALALANESFNWDKTVKQTVQFWESRKKRNSLSIV